jgi:DNA-binding transcriptional LysR family regulator
MGKQNSKDACGCVRMEAPALFGLQRLGGMLAMFMNGHPNIDVDLQANDGDADPLSDFADLAISVDRAIPETLIARVLTPLKTGLFASRAYLDRVGVPQHPRDLIAGDCMALAGRATCGELELCERATTNRYFIPRNGSLRANSADALIGAAIHGAGVALVPSFLAEQSHLLPVLAGWSSKPLDVHLIYRPRRLEPIRVRKLVDFLLEELTDISPANLTTEIQHVAFTSQPNHAMESRRLMAA